MYRLNALFTKYSKSVPLVASIPTIIAGNDWYEYIRHNNTTKSHTNSSFKPSLTLRSVRLEDTTLADQMNQIFERSLPSVVEIYNKTGMGTGVVVDEELGLIVTNCHVVQDCQIVGVRHNLDVKRYQLFDAYANDEKVGAVSAHVLYCRPEVDLAVICLYTIPGALPALNLSQRTDLKVGEPLLSIGNPGLKNSSTVSYVDGIDRPIIEDITSKRVLVHSPNCIGGYSGGPVIDGNGDVVAINFFKYNDYSLAMPSVEAIKIVKKAKDFMVKSSRKRFSMTNKRSLGVILERRQEGFVVMGLSIECAEGLEKDDIIVEINRKPLITFTQLEKEIQKGQLLELYVISKGEDVVIDVMPVSAYNYNCSRY